MQLARQATVVQRSKVPCPDARAGVALTFVTEPGAGTEVVASWSP